MCTIQMQIPISKHMTWKRSIVCIYTFRSILLARMRVREAACYFQRCLIINSDVHTQQLSGNKLIRHCIIPKIDEFKLINECKGLMKQPKVDLLE